MSNKMDIKNPEEQSRKMAAICSKNPKLEVYFRKLLFAQGHRYSLNSNKVPRHLDIYLHKYKLLFLFTDVYSTDILTVNIRIC